MADKLFLVEISEAGTEIGKVGKVMVQAASPAAARRVALDVALSVRKVSALEVLKLSASGIGILAEPETVGGAKVEPLED